MSSVTQLERRRFISLTALAVLLAVVSYTPATTAYSPLDLLRFQARGPAPDINAMVNAAANAPTEPVRQSNPFTDVMLKPPVYQPPRSTAPWNVFEIPALPSRFSTEFMWNRRLRGKWVYDFELRRSHVSYQLGSNATFAYYIEYQMLKEKLYKYQDAGNPDGELCSLFDLEPPYDYMFRPTSWRDMQVQDVELSRFSIYEKERTLASVSASGESNNYKVNVFAFRNGTLRSLAIGPDKWHFFNFKDFESMDNYEADLEPDLKLGPPAQQCVYSGALTAPYATRFQHHIPYLLWRPTQNLAKIRKTQAALAKQGTA